jgi:hypothetical protein
MEREREREREHLPGERADGIGRYFSARGQKKSAAVAPALIRK